MITTGAERSHHAHGFLTTGGIPSTKALACVLFRMSEGVKKKTKVPFMETQEQGTIIQAYVYCYLRTGTPSFENSSIKPQWLMSCLTQVLYQEGNMGCQSMGQLETDLCRQPGWEIPSKILTLPGNFRSSSLAGSTAQNPTNLDTHYPQVSSICLMVEWEQEPKHTLHCGQFSKQVLRNWAFQNL